MIIELPHFKAAMVEVLAKHEEELVRTWNSSFSEYTNAWDRKCEKGEGGVYQSLAEELDMEWWGEYWKLDAVFVKEWNPNLIERGYYASFLSVVIEHENNYATSEEEIYRLLAASASLKVLVTYPIPGTEQEWLDKYTKQIKVVDDIWQGYSAQQRYVVIFGGEDNDKNSVWTYYIYGHGEFRPF